MKCTFLTILLLFMVSLNAQTIDCSEWKSKNTDPILNSDIALKCIKASQKYGREYIAHAILSEWVIQLNEIDVPIKRSLDLNVMLRMNGKDCVERKAGVVQWHIGGGKYGEGEITIEKEEKACDCSCENGANSWKVPSTPEPNGQDPLDSNQ